MEITVDSLKNFYGCTSDAALSAVIKYSTVTIWKWRKDGIPHLRQLYFKEKMNSTQTKTPAVT